MDGGNFSAQAPQPPDTMYRRIAALRADSLKVINVLSWFSLFLLIPTIMGILHQVGILALAVILGMNENNEPTVMFLYIAILLTSSVGLAIALMFVVRIILRGSFKRIHSQVWHELHATNLAVMIADDAYTALISDRVKDTYGLAWLSPPPPKKLEDQLEFAACYHTALRKLLWGVGRLENAPLWGGSVAWYSGTTRGCTCGCLALWLLNVIGMTLWILGASLYFRRCAVMAAYCDFLLQDE